MKTGGDAKSHRSAPAEAGSGPRSGADSVTPRSTDAPWPGELAPAPLQGIAPSPESGSPFQSVGFTVSTIGYAVARRFREILAPLELEPREFALLRAVSAAEGQSQQAIGERLQIPPSRMVAFIDALEARSLLERRQNPEDRRTRALYLTDPGRELVARAFALAVEHERNLCADLSDPEREQLLALLQRVGLRLGVAPGVHAAHAHSALADE
jgi:DNA-binding MarR family transcriptional regulator